MLHFCKVRNKHHLAYIKLLTAELSFCQVTSHSSIWPLKSKRQSPFVSRPDHYQEFSFSLPISLCVNDFHTEFCFDSCIWYLSLWCIEICPLSLLIVNFEHVFLFRTTGLISTRLGIKHSWVMGIQVCSHDRKTMPFFKGIVKLH